MARTKANAYTKASVKAPRKARVLAPNVKAPKGASKSGGHGKGNAYCPRAVPEWQKPITNFYKTEGMEVDIEGQQKEEVDVVKKKVEVKHDEDIYVTDEESSVETLPCDDNYQDGAGSSTSDGAASSDIVGSRSSSSDGAESSGSDGAGPSTRYGAWPLTRDGAGPSTRDDAGPSTRDDAGPSTRDDDGPSTRSPTDDEGSSDEASGRSTAAIEDDDTDDD